MILREYLVIQGIKTLQLMTYLSYILCTSLLRVMRYGFRLACFRGIGTEVQKQQTEVLRGHWKVEDITWVMIRQGGIPPNSRNGLTKSSLVKIRTGFRQNNKINPNAIITGE